MCKLLHRNVANDVTRGCVQLFGGYGYSRSTCRRAMRMTLRLQRSTKEHPGSNEDDHFGNYEAVIQSKEGES